MRTPLKVAIGAVVSISAVTGWALLDASREGNAGPPLTVPTKDDPASGGMAMCIEGVPDCDDMVVVPGGDEPVADRGGDPVVDHVPDPQLTQPNADAVDLRARPFDSATAGDDDRTVNIDFVSGVEPCYVLGRIDVDEGPNAVRITLFEGHLPTDEDVACIDLGVFKRTTVTLDEPLGDRRILDGAA